MIKHSDALDSWNHIWNVHTFPFNDILQAARGEQLYLTSTMAAVYIYFKNLRKGKQIGNRLGIGKLFKKIFPFLPQDRLLFQLPYYETLLKYFTQKPEVIKAIVPIKDLTVIADYYKGRFLMD